MQFICFVGHSFADREAKIGFLCLEGENIKLCWLICKQPFEKKLINDLIDFEIVEREIVFKLPILDDIDNIRRAEFFNAPGASIEECDLGAIIIQTTTEIWF